MIELLILSIVALAFFAAYILPRLKIKDEKDKEALLRGNCTLSTKGIIFNSGSLPGAARFAIYDEFMVLSNIFRLKISYTSISGVSLVKRVIFPDSVNISLLDRSGRIDIYTNNASEIYPLLEKMKK